MSCGTRAADYLAELHRHYDGRVFAFDYPTLSDTPQANVVELLSRIPANAKLELDVVSHSHGGLVARVLAEQRGQHTGDPKDVAVRRVVFAGSPNDGTPLVDAAHMSDYLDVITTLLSALPDELVIDTLSAVIAVVKQLAADTVKGPDGLQGMLKGGDFLTMLNAPTSGDTRYYVIDSNYRPTSPALLGYAETRLLNGIFHAANDLVVPSSSVWEINGSNRFSLVDRLDLDPADHVSQSGYFANQRARNQMLSWLAPS